MPAGKSRTLLGTSAAVVMVLGLGVTPAFADDPPPPNWTMMPGYPMTVGDFDVSFESASSLFSPFDGSEMIEPMLVYRPSVTNNSDETRYIGFGTDFEVQGEIDELWTPEAWGAFSDLMEDSSILDIFVAELAPGMELADANGASGWSSGMPAWSGHTITMFELIPSEVEGENPAAIPLAAVTTPGRFVAADLSDGSIDNLSAVLGQRATVVGGSGTPELFAGLAGTVTASGLPPNQQFELWIAKDFNYAYFQILGGALPVGAVKVGTGTVNATGALSTAFALPFDLEPGSYQLVVGSRTERYWPAGSYDDFTVGPRPNLTEEPNDPVGEGGTQIGLDLATTALGSTQVTITYPEGTSAGLTSAVHSTAGPIPLGFAVITDPPLYLHLSTTAEFDDDVVVCIDYDPGVVTGPTPRMYHFDPVSNTWQDITSSQQTGQVCGVTSSFSPFVLGYPETFDFEGFFEPVSNDGPNVAKAGQAIPVKFSLGGESALDVVTSARFVVDGTDAHPSGEMLDAVTAGKSGLSYDGRTDRYTFVWKTEKSWALKTGRFVMELSDGTTHEFEVSFKK